MVLLNTLVLMETAKNNKIKNKVTYFQQSTKKGLRISTRQTGLWTSTEPPDWHTSKGYIGFLEFTGLADLQTTIGRTGLLKLTWHTGFLVSTGRTILEFTGLLELTVCTVLLEFTESTGLRTSTGHTDLLELTGRKGLLESTVQILTGNTKLLELTGHTSVLKLTGHTGFLVSTGHNFLEFTSLLELTVCKNSKRV